MILAATTSFVSLPGNLYLLAGYDIAYNDTQKMHMKTAQHPDNVEVMQTTYNHPPLLY